MCLSQDCDPGFAEINSLCFHEGDLSVIQKMIDNSYQSGIDLGCEDWDNYCGSPNPYMDSIDSWFWKIIDGENFYFSNGNGVVEPLELGLQEWQDGRLTSIMCGAYIYCQLSGPIPEEIINLNTIIETIPINTLLVTAARETEIVTSPADKGANNKSTIVPSIFLIIKDEEE